MFGGNFSPPSMASPSDTSMFPVNGLDDTFSMGNDAPTFEPMDDFLNMDSFASPEQTSAQLYSGSPAMFQTKTEMARSPLAQFQPRSAVSSASPESSTQDSSSDSSGRRKRKSPSESSPSATVGSYPSATGTWANEGLEMARGKRRPKHDSPVLKQEDASMGMLNNSMTQSFSIKSAGNSPPGMMVQNVQPNATWNMGNMGTPKTMAGQEFEIRTKSPATFQFGASSRDNTPPSAMSFESPNNMPFMMMRDSPDTDSMGFGAGRSPFGANGMENFTMFSPMPAIQTTTNMATISRPQIRLYVSPLGHKSRVETQIPIKLTMDPCPPQIKKVHLPTETIAKAKFLAKDTPLSMDTIELSAMLVCSSAMDKPENKQHALKIAASGTHLKKGSNPRRSSTGDTKKGESLDPNDPDSPLNGGPVRICDNCVSRERKRAGRKKAKKQEDEERWHEYEHDRIVMFNTQEYLEVHPPTAAKEAAFAENVSFSPEAKQIDAPMRIVCYCRHQQEKIGFQVIFTAKDWQGRVLAQVITQSILITDDHKTHTHGVPSTAGLAVADNSQINVPNFMGGAVQPHGLPGRAYHSSTNLAGMNTAGFWPNMNNSIAQGQRSTTSMTPRNLSRPASPSGHNGPKKKRKGSSGQHKIPADLMMTRSDMDTSSSMTPANIMTSAPPQAMSTLVSPDVPNFGFDTGMAFGSLSQQNTFNTSPPTPEAVIAPTKSREQTDNYFYSAPNSAHPSRAASPTSFARQQMGMFQPQSATNAQFGMTFPGNDSQQNLNASIPSIFKVRPDRGPITGNVEVVILGKNFSRNLEVRFGDNIATTTTFWNSDTLVCLLPPTLQAGTVPVTFVSTGTRGYSPQGSTSPIFTYVDDTRQQLFELAIQLQATATMGPNADHLEYARQILGSTQAAQGFQGGGYGGGNVLSAGNTEQLLMTMLNKVDLIDSPFKPYYDHRREGGPTMLGLACRLGYENLVAGLLARGADFDVADAGGFTPLMMAARHGNIAIVRRLILRGADPSLRNLRGTTAAELACSPEVRHYVRHRRHYRSASAGTPYLRSRANSAASTRSLWGPPSSGASSTMYSTEDESAVDSSDEEEVEVVAPVPMSALASRRQSLAALQSRRGSELSPVVSSSVIPTIHAPNPVENTAAASTIAVFSAWRDQLTAQINALQQNLGSMQISDLQDLPALSRRFSQLMPANMRRETSSPPRTDSPSSEAPPPYHVACPDGVDNDFDTKPSELFAPQQQVVAESSQSMMRPNVSPLVRQRLATGKVVIGTTDPTGEEAAELRRMRQEKLTPVRRDTNLWYIWFPLLIMLMGWYLSGLQAPPLRTWLKAFNETVNETFGKSLPSLPNVPERMRQAVAG